MAVVATLLRVETVRRGVQRDKAAVAVHATGQACSGPPAPDGRALPGPAGRGAGNPCRVERRGRVAAGWARSRPDRPGMAGRGAGTCREARGCSAGRSRAPAKGLDFIATVE